jgi:hypothetical protein
MLMKKNRFRRLASSRKQTLVITMALAASLAALSGASSALATPKGEFAVFADCPVSNAELSACIVASTTGGEFTVGKRTVPIKNTITLQGGFIESETGALTFVGAADGNTLSKTPQTVPGGLFGIEGLGGEVTATTELAGPASSIGLNEANLLKGEGTALSLPVKVKLSNPFLGNKCYIGSNAHPIILNLTTGTTNPPKPNKPIKGSVGTIERNAEGTILTVSKNSLVDNSFAAPGVEGCGLIPFLVDPLVDLSLGVPAAAGHNTAILNGTLRQAGAEAVREHE